jgi:hypothetical protein
MKIRARISAKLKDQSGASITYALLLFLVCAVVSSVVLAAGTAASGRMSKAVETDQRYYSVASTAELLLDLYDGAKIVTQTTQTTQEGESGSDVVGGYPKYFKDSTELESEAAANYNLLSTVSGLYTGTSMKTLPTDAMPVTVDSTQYAAIQARSTADGGITFAVSSYKKTSSGAESTDKYTLYLVFGASVNQITDTKTTDGYNDSGEMETKTKLTVTTEITWSLTSMSTTPPEGWT